MKTFFIFCETMFGYDAEYDTQYDADWLFERCDFERRLKRERQFDHLDDEVAYTECSECNGLGCQWCKCDNEDTVVIDPDVHRPELPLQEPTRSRSPQRRPLWTYGTKGEAEKMRAET